MNIWLLVKVKILMLIKQSYKFPPLPCMLTIEPRLIHTWPHTIQMKVSNYNK